MDLPKRKPTRLRGYNYNRAGAYFITICTFEKQKLLCRIVDDGLLSPPTVTLTEAGKIVEKYIHSTDAVPHVKVDKYVIMPNHIHLLLRVENGTPWASSPTHAVVPQAVSAFKRLVGKALGNTIFQRSFHDHIVRNEQDYQRIWEYIDTNPYKWKTDIFYTE